MFAYHIIMKTFHRLARPLLAAALTLFATVPPALAAPAIPNPSFELDNFTVGGGTINVNGPIMGWTESASNRVGINPAALSPFADNGIIPNGTHVAFVQTTGGTTTLSTTITGLTAGTSYRVQFRANCRDNNTFSADPVAAIRLNGGAAVRFTAAPNVNNSGVFTNPYYTVNAIFTATATTAALEISNSAASDSTLLVDDFKITAATNITVTNTNDSGAGSLRAALATAAGTPVANVITFAPALSGQTITLAGEIVVNDADGVVIDASSLPNGLTIDGGAGTNRIFSVATGALMSLRRLTFTGGNGSGATSSGNGGAIFNQGTLSLTSCTLFTNSANSGGAIQNFTGGQLELTQCTLSNNAATSSEGGAFRNEPNSAVALTHCTISGNTSVNHGGGITNRGTLTLTNTILAANTSPNEADIDNYGGTVTRVGANIVNVHVNANGGTDTGPAAINANPLLTALANNGGATQTMAIAYTSPARNAAVGSTVTTDQRGLLVVGTPDIGAFEMQAGTFVLGSTTYQTPEGSPATITINRTAGFSGTATVRVFTTNGTAGAADFTAQPNTAASDVIFFDGDTSKSVNIPTLADFLPEGNETFLVSLGSPTLVSLGSSTPPAATLGSPSTATVTIVDSFQVTNTNDDGAGSLRQAIADAKASPGRDRIYFAPTLNGKVIVLGSEIVVADTDGVVVDASNLAAGITIDGGPGANRIFTLFSAGSSLDLTGLTLTGGGGAGAGPFTGFGGAICVSQGASVTLTRCTLSGNSSPSGGGAIENAGGTLSLTQCTLSGNSTAGDGGAIEIGQGGSGGTTFLTHCTVAGNTAGAPTQGVFVSSGTATITNSIVARGGSGSYGLASPGSGTLIFVGANVVEDFYVSPFSGPAPILAAPLLGPLASNGGPTQTMALMANSPALNSAIGSSIVTDQRGKPAAGTQDIGAFEAQTGGSFMLSQTGYSTNEGGPVTITIKRADGFSGAAKVRLVTTPGTASTADFTGRPNSAASDIDFAATDAVKTVMINTTADMLVEPNETFTVSLSLPAPAAPGVTLGSPSKAMVTIIDPSASSNVLDIVAPAIPVITTPAANAVLSLNVGDSTPITGSATDNKGVATVTASVNGGGAIPLTLTSPGAPSTGFTGNLTGLVAGINSVTVTATDFAGRTRTSTTRSFKVLRPLLVIVSGAGTVSPAGIAPKSFREVGQFVTLTATPGAGAMFDQWVISSGHTASQLGILASALGKPTLSFIHREGLVLQAVLKTNPYPALAAAGAAGTDYTGLIHADPGSPAGGTAPGLDTEGCLKVTLMSTGAFSGVIKMGGTTLPAFAGSFDPSGTARFGTARSTSIAIVRPGKPSLLVGPLTIDLNPGRTKDTITGTITATGIQVSQVTAVSKVIADRAFYDGVTNIVPAAYLGASNATQAYTGIFPQLTNAGVDARDFPQGDGYGFLTVSKAGLVMLTAGKLADGTVVSGSFKLSKVNTFPLFLQLYPAGALTRGYLSGDVTLNAMDAASDMSALANLQWLRPTDTTQQYYPGGWPGIINVGFMGARYEKAFTPASSVLRKADGGDGDLIGDPLNAPDPVNGNATLSFLDGKLSGTIAKLVSITPANAITKVPANDPDFTLNAFMLSNGMFSGKFVHELDAGVPAPMQTDFQGALYQKGPNAGGYGFFLTRKPTPIDFLGESGAVSLFGTP